MKKKVFRERYYNTEEKEVKVEKTKKTRKKKGDK